jgi:hypothetical protein
MSEITHDISTAANAEPFIHRIWPKAIVGIGLSATVLWTCFLAYEFGRLVQLLI